MKITMYGAPICGDCVVAKEELLKKPEVTLDYRNITESTKTLKEFLSYRDKEEMFAPIREQGKIGIPFFLLEDGTKTFDIDKYVTVDLTRRDMDEKSFCTLDGKGSC